MRYFVGAYALLWIFWSPAVLADAGRLFLPLPTFASEALGGPSPMLAVSSRPSDRGRAPRQCSADRLGNYRVLSELGVDSPFTGLPTTVLYGIG